MRILAILKKFMTITFIITLFGASPLIYGEEFLRIFLGPESKIEPGQGKTTGLGELHWGLESKYSYLALVIGVGSKSLLSPDLFKNLDMVKMLNTLASPENEFYFGTLSEGNIQLIPFKSQPLKSHYPLVGGSKVPPGIGIGGRVEGVANVLPRKSEKDPLCYPEIWFYVKPYLATKLMVFSPMVGIGLNDRLDHYYKKEPSSEIMGVFSQNIEKDNIIRWKWRVDMYARNPVKIGNSGFQLFLSIQRDMPIKKKYSMLQLEDGSLAKAPILREMTIRFGISIDFIFKKENSNKNE